MPSFVAVDGWFEYVHLLRDDDPSLVYTVETTTDLVSGTWTNTGFTVSGTNVTGGAYDDVTKQYSLGCCADFRRVLIQE